MRGGMVSPRRSRVGVTHSGPSARQGGSVEGPRLMGAPRAECPAMDNPRTSASDRSLPRAWEQLPTMWTAACAMLRGIELRACSERYKITNRRSGITKRVEHQVPTADQTGGGPIYPHALEKRPEKNMIAVAA